MVVIFQSEKARRYLLEHGEVYTFRAKKRRRPDGRDWMTDRRGGKKICDVEIRDLTRAPHLTILDLGSYVEKSGFDSVRDWLREIERLNHGELPDAGYIYHIARVERR